MKTHGKAIASARAGNVIGGGDWAKDRIVPDCIRALQNNQSIEIRSPLATRPWQHVLEPLSGYLLLASKLMENGEKYSGAWNFGPNDESIIHVKEVVEKIIDNWGEGNWSDLSKPNTLHEAKSLSLDCTKAKTYLKWKPVFNIDDAIELTVDWYKNYMNKNVYELCRNQIAIFQEIMSAQEYIHITGFQQWREQRKDFLKEVASSSHKLQK